MVIVILLVYIRENRICNKIVSNESDVLSKM